MVSSYFFIKIVKVTELKQGYEAEEAVKLANSALLGANVTGLGTAEMADRLVGALAQFNIEAKDSIRIIDKINEVNIISLLIW